MYQLDQRGRLGDLPTRTLLTPAEAERAVQETNDAWNVLRNELYGRGAAPRTDVPVEFQSRVLREYAAYRAFVDRLTAFDSVINNFSGELSQWRRIYEGLRGKWATMSVTSMAPELQETQGPGQAVASVFSSIAAAFAGLTWPVLLTAGGVGIAVLGWTAFLARPVRAQAKYAPRHRRAT